MYSSSVWILLCFAEHLAAAQAIQDDTTSYIFYDNIEWLSNNSNIIPMSYPSIQEAFANPNKRDSASFPGLDWTKPFPGELIDGFGAHLRVAHDVEVPESVMPNVTTQVSAITYNIPQAMMDGSGGPKAMDPSWYICQHYYVSTRPDPTQDVDHSCGFLPDACLADLNASLTESWGKLDDSIPCSGYALGSIPTSCRETLGPVRSDVLGKSTRFLVRPPDQESYNLMNPQDGIVPGWRSRTLRRHLSWIKSGNQAGWLARASATLATRQHMTPRRTGLIS